MAAGSIKLQANDSRVASVVFEDGASGNVSVVIPKEGGEVLTTGTTHTHTLANISNFPAAVTATELGYLDGVTSNIQAQIGTINTSISTLTTNVDALKDVAANAQSVSYTLALTDRGKSIDTSAGVTVPLNATVAFPIGTVITITNTSAAAITLTQTAGVTLRQAGTANTGNRTLAAYGMATLRKTATDTWFISGAGLS